MLSRQQPSTPAPSYLPMLPSGILSHKSREADESVFGPQLSGPSVNLVVWDSICATERHHSYRQEIEFDLSAHCGKLGGTSVCR